MAIGAIFGRLTGPGGSRRWAAAASLVWVVVVLAYGIGFLSVASATETRGTLFLDAMFFLVALVLPLGLIWLAAWLAEELRRQREIVTALAEVTAPLVAALDETRASLAHHASPDAIAQAVGSAVGEAVAGVRPADVSRPLSDLAAGQARLEAALARLTVPATAPETRREPAAPAPAPATPSPAAAEAAADATTPAFTWDQLVRALDFPRDADDREGFRALKAAQQQPKLGETLQAAEDVLNLLSQEGIFVDELTLDEVEPSSWRRFMAGVRGAKVASIGGITDPQALEVAGRLLKQDAVFRDTAMFFLRRFERVLANYAKDADDHELVALAGTRSGRAFMILSRSSGIFA
jgi:hypothetical protein